MLAYLLYLIKFLVSKKGLIFPTFYIMNINFISITSLNIDKDVFNWEITQPTLGQARPGRPALTLAGRT